LSAVSEPDDTELLMSMLNGFTMSRVNMNTHSVTRIRSGRPANAGGLDTHSATNNDKTTTTRSFCVRNDLSTHILCFNSHFSR